MKPKDFKILKNRLRDKFIDILSNCYTDFIEVDITKAVGQVFTINAFYGEEYINEVNRPIEDVNIVRPVLHFQAEGLWKNERFDVNSFFKINDEVFNEFYEISERQEFDCLIPILKTGLQQSNPKDIGQAYVEKYFFISLESNVHGANQFYRDLLDEGVATIEYDEENNSIVVSCSQSERRHITALINGDPVSLRVPYDKVDNFQAFKKEAENVPIDEKYIFIAMSFQKDPLLEDTYSTIQRAVKGLRKGLKCERVDDIQDDFVINDKIFDCIKKSKLLIVDLTGNRPNVYYELGYARALGKHIILLCKEGDKPHFDVSNQNTIFYNNSTALEKSLKTRLRTVFH